MVIFNYCLRDRKGISEVISAILVIVIAIAIGLALFTYSTGVFGTAHGNFLLEAQMRKETVEERFVNTATWNDSQGFVGLINFTIFNYGMREVIVAAIYVNGTEYEMFFKEGEEWKSVEEAGYPTINVNEVKWISVQGPWGSTLHNSKIVVSSKRGNTFEFVFGGRR